MRQEAKEGRLSSLLRKLAPAAAVIITICLCAGSSAAPDKVAWGSCQGVLRDGTGRPLAGARLELRSRASSKALVSTTDAVGRFAFSNVAPDSYFVSVRWQGRTRVSSVALEIGAGATLETELRISADFQILFDSGGAGAVKAASGGEQLSSRQVSGLPLNKRDFSQLLLLAAGTMTDTNGSVNFTQQFAVNGQRGTTAVFAMDGLDTSDPELGGATFSNFNVDAIQEIDSSSGVMPAEIGRGAAGFTNIITKSGGAQVHGSVFEFVRNAAFDARNLIDHRSIVHPGRIPPFVRNEFGFTIGGLSPCPVFTRGATGPSFSASTRDSVRSSGPLKCSRCRRWTSGRAWTPKRFPAIRCSCPSILASLPCWPITRCPTIPRDRSGPGPMPPLPTCRPRPISSRCASTIVFPTGNNCLPDSL